MENKPMIVLIGEDENIFDLVKNALPPSFSLFYIRGGKEILDQVAAVHPQMILLEGKGEKNPSHDSYPLVNDLKKREGLSTLPLILLNWDGPEEWEASSPLGSKDSYLPPQFTARELSSCVRWVRKTNQWDREEWDKVKGRIQEESKWIVLGRLVGGIIHEINNPLTIVGLNSNLLAKFVEKKVTDLEAQEKMDKFSKEISKALDRINLLLSEVRNFIVGGDQDKVHPIALNDILQGCMGLCANELKKKQIDVYLDTESLNREGSIHGQKIKICEAFVYLLFFSTQSFGKQGSMAKGASGKERWIKISATHREGKIQIILEDNAEHSPEMEGSVDPFAMGPGVGLKLSKKIIEQYQGDLSFSRGNPGHKWVIEFPKLATAS